MAELDHQQGLAQPGLEPAADPAQQPGVGARDHRPVDLQPDPPEPPPRGAVLVDRARLAPSNSYGAPDFVSRGYYLDRPFRCVDCDIAQVWTAAQQQWWYEVAKGFVYSFAKRCRGCRQARRARRGGGAGGGAAGGGAS